MTKPFFGFAAVAHLHDIPFSGISSLVVWTAVFSAAKTLT
jgi:hypothetical protein